MAFIGRSSADVLRADDTSPEPAFPAQTWILSGDSFAKGAFLRNRFSFRLLFPPFFPFPSSERTGWFSACQNKNRHYRCFLKKNVVLSLLGLVLLVSAVAAFNMACAEKSSNRADIARKRVTPVLNSFLEPCGARVGSPVFLRAVKEDSVLELWVKPDKSECYMLAKRYPIAAWSGKLGPKEKEGDRQTPEGFYEVEPSGLNPRSNYHLSFNIGYPNAYDRSLNRTGSFIMVHGRDVSIGCLAMTDSGIEEIYIMVEQALVHGQKTVPVQIYPFVPTPARLSEEKDSPHAAFWADMARAWDWTERTRTPARVKAVNGRLVVVEQ